MYWCIVTIDNKLLIFIFIGQRIVNIDIFIQQKKNVYRRSKCYINIYAHDYEEMWGWKLIRQKLVNIIKRISKHLNYDGFIYCHEYKFSYIKDCIFMDFLFHGFVLVCIKALKIFLLVENLKLWFMQSKKTVVQQIIMNPQKNTITKMIA